MKLTLYNIAVILYNVEFYIMLIGKIFLPFWSLYTWLCAAFSCTVKYKV